MNTKILLTFLSGIIVYGCATPYQSEGIVGGYDEEEISPGVYELEFRHSIYTGERTVQQYWHRRAGELCGGEGSYRIIEDPEVVRHFTLYYGRQPYKLVGQVECLRKPQEPEQR